jgi:cold-inducible RNA-binding protein
LLAIVVNILDPIRAKEIDVSKKLYVGNVPFSADDASLADWFAPFGNVESAKIITDRDSGRSKGFGFVEMSSDEEAAKAIQSLDGSEVDGREIRVNEARPRTDRGGGGGGGGYKNRGRNRY